ncbi:ABC transporter substrate-binding protein [Aldersonia sp. NBC_00410]|uniref:ABC transporter substrate-binding protein n=1 Tax=Aldersonia sp. NBC_00410 TaxID=2975954 RepID=UPI00224E9046|nr:ABC transporter substrate-binding protein [Aldersonia sp. NBC_00410]MCX5043518.1 ABC transporter substrate-binding protein [Aldersonia sp. NBC_00410]
MSRDRGRGFFRRLALAAIAASMAVGLVACSGDSSGEQSGSGDAVTIDHAQGQTTIEGVPERVVALGSQWADASQALGVTPVGYLDLVSMSTGGRAAPWDPPEMSQAAKIDPQGDIVEQVAELNPDLILAPGFGADKTTFDKLSALAPTIANLSTAQIEKWQDQVSTLGKIYHKPDEATQVINEIEGRITGIRDANPGLAGKTFLTAYLASPTQLMVLADPNDGSSALFTELGMVLPQQLVDEAGSMGGRIALSPERVADLDADLLVATAAPGMEQAFTSLPGYADLPAVRNGGLAFIDIVTGTGMNMPTPLSLPYVLDQLEPTLVKVGRQP